MAGSGDKPEEPLTSTSMFLRSFGAAPAEEKPVEEGGAGGGFRFSEERVPPPQQPASEPPAQAPGEFTRLFVRPTPSGEHERLTSYPGPTSPGSTSGGRPEQSNANRGNGPSAFESLNSRQATGGPPLPPPAAAGANPGQYFSREIARPFPPPANRAEPAPTGDYSRAEQALSYGPTPTGPSPAPPSSEVADLLRDLYSEQNGQAGRGFDDRQRGPDKPQEPFRDSYREPYREPAVSFARQPPQYDPSPTPPASSVTVMLDRLALDEAMASLRTPSPERPAFQPEPAPLPTAAPAGPGEYTRVINRLELGQSGVPVQEPAAVQQSSAAALAAVSAPAFQMPAVSRPAIVPPVAGTPAVSTPAISVPRIEAPKLEAPKVAAPAAIAPVPVAPAVAAPKSKLQEMLPLLLVANAFLMIVLIVVVVFALRAKT